MVSLDITGFLMWHASCLLQDQQCQKRYVRKQIKKDGEF